MKRELILAALSIAVPLSVHGQPRCEYRDVVELSAAAGDELLIIAGSGALDVEGGSTDRIQVTATLCASDEGRLQDLDATLDEARARTVLETHYPDRGGWGNWGENYARIDLTVRIPEGMALEVDDGSGSATISRVGRLVVSDGSGNLTISGAVDVRVEDGSGTLVIEDVVGNVEVSDGSGGLEITNVSGDVLVDDGSGGIDIRTVGGTVRVEEMGSGALRVDEVRGDLVVEDGRYERIRHSGVEGELRLPEPRRRRRS